MTEANLNTILKNSIKYYGGWCHKIADGVGGISTQNPFDSLGIFNNKPLYVEAKLIKGFYSFNFNRIESHQTNNLMFIENSLSKTIPNKFYSLVVVGFYEPRKFFYLLFFSIRTLDKLRKEGINSIKKKELEIFIKQGKYLSVVWMFDKNQRKRQCVEGMDRLDEVLI